MKTKREVLAWLKLHDIHMDQEYSFCDHHIHLYAPNGMWFASHGIHNLCVWSGSKPDWAYIGRDLLSGGEIEPCPLDDCEVCHS